jgi:hypothetical protein
VTLLVLSPREASIFACVCDTVVAPEPLLPPVRTTDAVTFFDRWLVLSPRRNRAGLRALLYAAELAPRLLGFRARLRALAEADRALVLEALERVGEPRVRELVRLFKGVACLSYYGDDAVMLQLGYDADANVRRARELRARERRP